MQPAHIADELARLAPFSSLSGPARELLSREAVHRQFARRAAVLYRGQPVSGAYIVLSGRLRVFTITPGGTEATLYFIGPGETCVLALNCLFSDVLYPSWVEAETATRIALVPGAVYRRLFESEPAIQDLTVSSLSTLVYRLMAELDGIHAGSVKQRLAQFILTHADSGGTLAMTQQQVAGHLGTTREVVARLMQELVGRGLVRTGRSRIDIADLFALRRIVAPDATSAPATQRRR